MSDRLLIRASAGSGKTFRLSGHYLRQLFLGERPETILATTFTRKAAGEILGRVLLRLADAATSDRRAAELAAFLSLDTVTRQSALQTLADLTHNLHRVRVCTLDSFFQQMARSLSLELGLPAGWTIIDQWMEADLQQQAIDAVLAGHSISDARDLMHRLAKDRSRRSVRDLIADSVETYYSVFLLTDESAWKQLNRGRRLTQADLDTAIDDVLECELPASKHFTNARTADLERFRGEQWDEFLTKGLAAKILNGDSEFHSREIPHDAAVAYQPLIEHACSELIGQLARQNESTWDLIARFDAEYTRLQNEYGWLRFSDVTRILGRSDAARDGDRIAFRLDQTVRHLLLDEFQDTSPDQWRIMKSLTAALTSSGRNSSFFCVGDPKQAIYGWRGAEAAILDAVQDTVPDLASEPLVKSRRSSPVVIETINAIFEHIDQHSNLGDHAEAVHAWVKAFPRHETARNDAPGYVRFALAPNVEGDLKAERKNDFIPWAAEQIRVLHEQHPHVQIGVLTRKNDTVARLVHALAQIGVPASEEGGTPPVDSPAALAMLSLLHLASHPGCTVSAFHVARSPLGPVVELSDWSDARQRSQTAAVLRAGLLDDGYGNTLQRISEAVRPFCSRRDRVRLQQIVAAAWQFDETPSLNPCDFVRLIETSRFGTAEDAPVRVMTIHQSKGLEFDVVVLPELDADLGRPPRIAVGRTGPDAAPDRVCIWRDQKLLAMLPEPLQEAFRQTRDRQMTEALCVMYVALTRAAFSLHLLGMPTTGKSAPKSVQGLLMAALADNARPADDGVLYEAGDPEWFRSLETKAPRRRRPRVPAMASSLSLQPLPNGRRRGLPRRAPSRHDEHRLFLPDTTTSRTRSVDEIDPLTRGTVMHAWFECIDWLVDGQRPEPEMLRRRTAELSLPESTINTLLPDFYALLEKPDTRSALSQSAAAESPVFTPLAEDIARGKVQLRVCHERSFAWIHQHTIVQGAMDRLVLARRGHEILAAEVLDFKTDRLVGDPVTWVRERTEHYRSQLQEYRAAVRHCFRLPDDRVATRLLLLEADACPFL